MLRLHPKAADADRALFLSLRLARDGEDAQQVRAELWGLPKTLVLVPLEGGA